MNAKLVMKFVVVLAVLLFMVMMGLSNAHPARLKLEKIGIDFEVNAAIMYFIFFAVGAITGLVLAVGVGDSKKSSSSSKGK